MRIGGELKEELVRTIKGINLLNNVKENITSQLSELIDAHKVKALFSEEISIDDLDDNEQYNLLAVLYSFEKYEKFNPKQLIKTNDNNEEKKEPTKDEMPHLYYNFEFKQSFSRTYRNKDTRRVVMALFRKTAKIEIEKDKDLYDFNIDELAETLKSLKSKTIRSLQNLVSTIERYVKYANKHKVTKYQINYATAFNSKDKLEELLDKEAEDNMIFDRDEIMEMAMSSDNAQDGVIVALLFDGVSHKNEFEELTSLTEDDIDNDEVILEDRVVPISKETQILVNRAISDHTYISIKGETSRKYKLAEGKNVIRGLRGKVKVKGQIISQRILRIAEIWDYKYLNATTISYSGQLYYAKKMMEEKRMTLDEVIVPVLERFGIPVNDSSKFYLKTRIEKYLELNR